MAAGLAGGVAAAGDRPSTTTVYQSKDADGRTLYSDTQPTTGVAARSLTFQSLPVTPLSAATLAFIVQMKKRGAARAAPAPAGIEALPASKQ